MKRHKNIKDHDRLFSKYGVVCQISCLLLLIFVTAQGINHIGFGLKGSKKVKTREAARKSNGVTDRPAA